MGCFSTMAQGLVENEMATRGISAIIRIEDACIIEINGRFFLIVKVIFDNTETAVVIRITRAQAVNLIRSGIRNCQVFTSLPTNLQGIAVELLCVFTVGREALLVFETERSQERLERLFVVRVPLCLVIGEDNIF